MDIRAVRVRGETGDASHPAVDARGTALLASIARCDDHALSRMIMRAANSTQPIESAALADIVIEACRAGRTYPIKKALTQLPGFNVNTTGSEGSSPLAAAIHAGDSRFVRCLLRLGANPSPCLGTPAPAHAQRDITKLLRAAKAINSLLPRDERRTVSATAPHLIKALRDYDLQRAKSLLKQEAQSRNVSSSIALWESAVRDRREDIQCAILALAPPKTIEKLTAVSRNDAFDVLHRSMHSVSPALRAYLKQFPYRSLKHDFPVFLNGAATFRETGEKVVCRHLSSHWLRERMIAGAWKNDYAAMSSADAISAGISSKIQASYLAWMNRSPEAHMIHVDDWGRFLADRLDAMLPLSTASTEPVRRRFFISTSNHAMVLELKIATRDNGAKVHSALLYDPNNTNTHIRASCADLSTARQWTFNAFLLVPDSQRHYLLEKTPLLMAFAIPDDHPALQEDFGASAPGAEPNRRLASAMFSPCREVFVHLLRGGFGGELRARKDEILAHLDSLDAKAAAHVLDARDGRRISGLYVACQEGHYDAVAAFGEILMASRVSAKDRAKILDCRCGTNPSGMYAALSLGHASTVAALGHVIGYAGLSPDAMKTLFLARFGRTNTPGVVVAHAKGHKAAVDAFKASVYLSDLTAGQREEIWRHMPEVVDDD